MNTRQGIAFSMPCFDAEATQRRRFRFLARADKWNISVVLTVNVGLD
jgi:hypothetical protein